MTMRSQGYGVAVTVWQMEIEKLTDAILVELLGGDSTATHPMRKVRQSSEIGPRCVFRVIAAFK
jgi:hypothetical protein